MPKQKIIPRGKYILVCPEKPEARQNEFGLIVPSNIEQEQKAMGVVLAIGNEITDIAKGDKIIYGVYAGEVIKLRENGKEVEYKLIFEEDVIAFLR